MAFGRLRALKRNKAITPKVARSEKIASLKTLAEKLRPASTVEQALRRNERALMKKKDALGKIKTQLLTTFSSDLRILRVEKADTLRAEIKELEMKRNALKTELPLARRADAIKKELGLSNKHK